MNESINNAITITDSIEKESVSDKNLLYVFIKRSLDIFGALLGLILLIPIILIIKVCSIINKDYKSIFFTQIRIGKDGKPFKLYKFRSMVPNADEILKEILKSNSKEAEEYRLMKKITNDPRVTKVGRFIRKYSIDEFPQIINILKGDMSFIGNRPYLPREIIDMGNYYDYIIKTKPGLTGYWQVNLRSRGTFEERLMMEKYYSNNYSFKMDMEIFFKTFKVVLKGDSAK